jgi:hypothetical protein
MQQELKFPGKKFRKESYVTTLKAVFQVRST